MKTDKDRPADFTLLSLTKAAQEWVTTLKWGWLSTLRTRLGLAQSRSLRETIENALREGPGVTTAFSAEERVMLRRLLRFGKSRVEDIMVPRADIIALDESESILELLTTFDEAGVSRVPVFSGTLDDPHGMIHIKDLFRWLLEDAGRKSSPNGNGQNGKHGKNRTAKSFDKPSMNGTSANEESLTKVATKRHSHPKSNTPQLDLHSVDLSRPISITKIKRPLLFVPPSMPAMNLLIRMQSTRNHMALVIDEYGGTDGLVTIEDLVEQIVGEIEDEHDDIETPHIIHDPKLGLLAAARTPLDVLEDYLKCKLLNAEQGEEIDTLGGLVFAIVGRIPARGEIIRHPTTGIEFEVLDADPRRIKTLKVHVPLNVERPQDFSSATVSKAEMEIS